MFVTIINSFFYDPTFHLDLKYQRNHELGRHFWSFLDFTQTITPLNWNISVCSNDVSLWQNIFIRRCSYDTAIPSNFHGMIDMKEYSVISHLSVVTIPLIWLKHIIHLPLVSNLGKSPLCPLCESTVKRIVQMWSCFLTQVRIDHFNKYSLIITCYYCLNSFNSGSFSTFTTFYA